MKPRLIFFCLPALAVSAFAAHPKHNYDLKNVLWKLSFDMARGSIAGDATNTLTLTEDSSTVELSCSELSVGKVTVNGAPAGHETKDDLLIVHLPSPAKAGQTLEIRAIYTGNPVTGFYFVPASRAFPAKTGMVYTQGEGEDNHYWLPTYDLPDDKATNECFVEVPPTWTAISNGRLLDVQTKPQSKVFHYKMEQPHSTYLISLVAGEYVEVKDQWHDIPVSFFVPPGLVSQGRASFGDTPKMVDLYSKLTGVDYPYAKFAQEVVGDFMFGGMENTTCVTQTIRTLHATGNEPVSDSTYLVAHELAHHWFGDMITCRTWEHMWLNEGFATTLPTFYTRLTRGQDNFDLDRYNNFEGAIDSIGSRHRKAVPGAAGSVKEVTMGSPYPGGCSRILMLMHLLGEDVFWKGIHEFLVTFKFQPATTDEFFAVMSRVSGQDLSGFARQWYHTAATPSLSVSVDVASLVVTQLEPFYTLDLPVWILDGADWVKKSIHVEGPESRLDLGDLTGKPLLIDPEVWTPMELASQMPYTWKEVDALYKHAPNAAQKARIIAGLFPKIPAHNRASIGHRETSPGLLQMIAGSVGQDGAYYLLELSHHSDEGVVNAAVQAMAGLPKDQTLIDRLGQIAEHDPNEAVREHATQALLNWADGPDLADKVWKLKAFDDGYRRMAMDWWGKHSPDEARIKALAILDDPDSEPLRTTAIEVLGRVKEKGASSAVYAALAPVAQETSYWSRLAAINALGALGNKSAIEVLEPFVTHGPQGIRGAAKAAIAQLRK